MPMSRRQLMAGLMVLAITPPSVTLARSKGARSASKAFKPSTTALRSSTVRASLANKGHMARHVSRDRSYLRARVQTGQFRRIFNAASKGADMRAKGSGKITRVPSRAVSPKARTALRKLANFNAKPKRISTFHSPKITDSMYRQALRANHKKIQNWMKNPKAKKSLNVSFASNRAIGTVFTGGRYKAANNGKFALLKGGVNGFFPGTAKLS